MDSHTAFMMSDSSVEPFVGSLELSLQKGVYILEIFLEIPHVLSSLSGHYLLTTRAWALDGAGEALGRVRMTLSTSEATLPVKTCLPRDVGWARDVKTSILQ